MVFRSFPIMALPDCRNVQWFESVMLLTYKQFINGTEIAISRAPVMYRLLGNFRPAQRTADAR